MNTMRFFILISIFLLLPITLPAQDYIVGTPVCDTLVHNLTYAANCDDDFLVFRLSEELIPFITGINFQVEITAVKGFVTSNVVDTVKAGDIFVIPPLIAHMYLMSRKFGPGLLDFLRVNQEEQLD